MTYLLLDKEKKIFLKEETRQTLVGTKKIIFDFDGVLVHTIQSYRKTIKQAVDYYFLKILCLDGEEGKLVTLRDIQKFKNTGLYNNDWKLSYTLISYYINLVLRKLEQENLLKDFTKQFSNIQFSEIHSFIQKLREVGQCIKSIGISGNTLAKLKDDNIVGLDLFLAQSSLEKPKPVETSLVGIDPEVVEKKEILVKMLVPYDLGKPDLLKRLFEEIYLGKDLFKKVYEIEPFFKFDASLLDIEEFIPTERTLKILSNQFGKFGIYSGRPRPQAMYVLDKYSYKKYFDEKKSVFLGNMLKSEEEMRQLGKPNPTLFIELIEKEVENETGVVYVGDGIADAILIERAKAKGLENLSFLGVLSSLESSNKLFTEYINHGADAIVTNVNDIPYLFTNLGGKI